jgi:hypothetical protein
MKFGICTVLFLIFLTLKLAGIGAVAAWSWVWVFAPLWIPLAIVASLFVLGTLVVAFGLKR